MTNADDAPQSVPGYPTARVEKAAEPWNVVRQSASRLWWATALCLLAAVGLTWAELSSRGVRIDIAFHEGHGLAPGDAVRYLGVDVGQVEAIRLTDDSQRVLVTVELTSGAALLAREGAQFWIERPDISIGRARGLDTLVGGRYVGVVPGRSAAPSASLFTGLDDAPASVHGTLDGLEIVLESSQRFGLQRGSPVNYRGVTIGHVLSVGLANDAVSVVARTHIQPEYRGLVRESTRFWSTSGIDIRIGLGGLELDAETLATIAAGGVSLATPSEPSSPVATGHRFELAKSPRSEWLEWEPRLSIGSALLPADAPMPQPVLAARQASGGFHLFGKTQQRGWLLLLSTGRLVGPSDMLASSGDEPSVLEAWGEEFALSDEGVVAMGSLASRALPDGLVDGKTTWDVTRTRRPDATEDVVVTCGSDDLTMTLARERLIPAEEGWAIDASTPLDEGWHGASVVAVRDGCIVGLLVYAEGRGTVALLSTDLLGR